MIVGVIGSGAIGPDLAYGFLTALAREPGSKVFLVDVKQEALDAGVSRIQGYVDKGAARGKIDPAAAKAILGALVPTRELSDLAPSEYVLEAASEDLEIKRRILASLEKTVRPDCLIGFATSGLPRRDIAKDAAHPERCFVNHPFFPAWRALPIEIVPSGDAALGARMIATIERLGKVPIVTADVPCFAADDVFCNYISEAARIVEEGIATPAQVDAIVRQAIGGGGPFNVMDLTKGNALTYKCQLLMQAAETGTAWFSPPAILSKQGDAPWHDRKRPGDMLLMSLYDPSAKLSMANTAEELGRRREGRARRRRVPRGDGPGDRRAGRRGDPRRARHAHPRGRLAREDGAPCRPRSSRAASSPPAMPAPSWTGRAR